MNELQQEPTHTSPIVKNETAVSWLILKIIFVRSQHMKCEETQRWTH